MTLATSALKCAKQLSRVNATGTAISDLESEIKDEIGETIRHYNRQPWALTELRGGVLTTVSGQTWYSSVDLTSGEGDQDETGRTAVDVNDIVALRYMRNSSSSVYFSMAQIPYPEFERMLEGGSSGGGYPSYFTRYAGQIGVWPTPGGAYSLYFSANVKPVVPTADSDTSVWLEQAGEMIEAGACKRVCLKYLRDTGRAAEFAAMEDAAKSAFTSEGAFKRTTGKLKVHY